jgi:hypothetical protein
VTEDRFLRIGYFRFANDPIFDADVDLETDNAFVAGKIARLVDSAGREVEFEYNDDGLLQKRFGVSITGANGGFSGRPTLEYLSADTCSGDLRGVRSDNGAGGGALFVADVDGEIVQPVVTGGSGVAGAVTVSPPGTNEASTSDAPSPACPARPATEFTFDENGLPKKIAAAGKDYDTTFNEHGLLEHVKYPADSEVFYSYDVANVSLRSRGNLLAVEHEPGSRGGDPITRSWSYDARYNQLSGAGMDENSNRSATPPAATDRPRVDPTAAPAPRSSTTTAGAESTTRRRRSASTTTSTTTRAPAQDVGEGGEPQHRPRLRRLDRGEARQSDHHLTARSPAHRRELRRTRLAHVGRAGRSRFALRLRRERQPAHDRARDRWRYARRDARI